MVYFLILAVIIACVSVPIFKKLQTRKAMADSLLNGVSCKIAKDSYFDKELEFFIDRKTLSFLKRNGHKGRETDLRLLPDYQIERNTIQSHIDKFILIYGEDGKYFNGDFIQFINDTHKTAYVEAFSMCLDEYYTKMVREESNDYLKKNLDSRNNDFSKEFNKKFEEAKRKLSVANDIDFASDVPDSAVKSLQKYVQHETFVLFQKTRQPIKDNKGEYTVGFKTKYKQTLSELKPLFFSGNKFSNDFVKYIKSTAGAVPISKFADYIPLYLNYTKVG